jgi:hypothetical protein
MNSATDHGYNADFTIKVQPGLEYRHLSAEGNHAMKVHRAHRDVGYWECVFLEGPRERAIWVRSGCDILRDAYAP